MTDWLILNDMRIIFAEINTFGLVGHKNAKFLTEKDCYFVTLVQQIVKLFMIVHEI